MRRDVINIKPLQSSFLSCEKDAEIIIKKLFVESKPYSDKLKRLLIVNEPDCLDDTIQAYQKAIDDKNLSKLRHEGYIRLNPKIARGEHEEIKSYIVITFDDFTSNIQNPIYRDCTLNFDIICYDDAWELENYQVRPLIIAGYIDGILNTMTNENKKIWNSGLSNIKLSGIGEYVFLGCHMSVLNEDLSMYTLSYRAIHFTEDTLKDAE